MTTLTALLLSDGRPGHYQRAEGILAAIARLRPVNTISVNALRRRFMPGRLLAMCVDAGMPPASILKLAYGLDAAHLPSADIVVSSGGNTLAANICAARVQGKPNIFYGGVRQFRPQSFSLVLTSYGGHASRPRHQMIPLMPVPHDPDAFRSVSAASLHHPPRFAGLLIGGDAGTIRFRPSDWERILAFVSDMHSLYGTRWFVSNSRRTPAAVSDAILERARSPGGPIADFIDVRDAGPGTLRKLFDNSDIVVCTDDSSSMITEAIWLRRPTVGIAPAQSGFAEREGWYRSYLAANGWTRSIPIAELSPARLFAVLGEIRPLSANPMDLLAATIRESLPELFSSL